MVRGPNVHLKNTKMAAAVSLTIDLNNQQIFNNRQLYKSFGSFIKPFALVVVKGNQSLTKLIQTAP